MLGWGGVEESKKHRRNLPLGVGVASGRTTNNIGERRKRKSALERSMAMDGPTWSIIGNVFDLITDKKLLEWEECLHLLEETDEAQVRQATAHKLKVCVGRLSRELSTESFEKFESELRQRVFNLLGQEVSRRGGGSRKSNIRAFADCLGTWALFRES